MNKPIVLIGVFLVILGCISLIIAKITSEATLKDLVTSSFILLIGLIFVFSGIMAVYIYKEFKRPYDLLIVPLFSSILFICITGLLLFFLYFFKPIYDSTEPNLNKISFPLALFAFGVSIYYFVVGQFSTEKKLDLILEEIKKLKNGKETENLPGNTKLNITK
jgi:hypothetical protein